MDNIFALLAVWSGRLCLRTVYHLFFTEHDVLPGNFAAIWVQWLPIFTLSLMISSSSQGSKGALFTSGCNLNCHLSRHCLADRPGIRFDNSSQHMWPEKDAIESRRSLSSVVVHGPLPTLCCFPGFDGGFGFDDIDGEFSFRTNDGMKSFPCSKSFEHSSGIGSSEIGDNVICLFIMKNELTFTLKLASEKSEFRKKHLICLGDL